MEKPSFFFTHPTIKYILHFVLYFVFCFSTLGILIPKSCVEALQEALASDAEKVSEETSK